MKNLAPIPAVIPHASLDSTSTSTVMKATVPGIDALFDGVCVWLTNGVVTSASGFTIDINGLGGKPVYSSQAAASRSTTLFNVNYTALLIYNESRVSGGCWDYVYGYDSNTNTIAYQVRSNSSSLPMTSVVYRYRLLFTSADGAHFVPATNSTTTNATSTRTVCQDKIDPFGRIVYYGTTASVAAGSRPSASALWELYTINLGYSFQTSPNYVLTLWKPVYLVCAPQTDGSAIIDSTTPITQTLPSTADGKIYILLGVAYSETNIELLMNHPVYYYKDGAIRLWTNASFGGAVTSVNGQTGDVTISVPSASSATPQALGTASAGTSTDYSRADHVHEKPTYSKSDVGLGNVDNVQQYSASNPPPYPVTSVNTQTGAVSLSASDVGALPDTTTYVSSFNGSTGAVTYTAPVTSVNGNTGAVTVSVPTKTSDLTNDSGYITGMYIASYGVSTYADILAAFNANKVVYCRASSNSNPATGNQGRLAFLAFVDYQSSSIAGFEFQYYRSVSSHSASQQGDQVFVYKITSNGTWTVTTREAATKVVAGTGMGSSYSNGTLTLTASGGPSAATADPLMDGTAAVGSSSKYAKEDHVHPSDTSRVNASASYDTWASSLATTGTIQNLSDDDGVQILTTNQNGTARIQNKYSESESSPEIKIETLNANASSYTAATWDVGTFNVNVFSSQGDNNFTMTPTATTITNVVTPTNNGDAVPKSYVDARSLPTVSASDNGKVLMVVNGAWAVASLPVYNGGVS